MLLYFRFLSPDDRNKQMNPCPACISETSELVASLPESDKELEGLSMTQGGRDALTQAWHTPLTNLTKQRLLFS